MQRIVISTLAALLLASCAEGPSLFTEGQSPANEGMNSASVTFDARDFAWSTAAGSGSIDGTFAYHQGQTRFGCQGSDALLTPDTAWSRRRMIILYGSATSAAVPVSIVRARTPSAGTGDYARFVRRTTCDADNHFSFRDLPDGSWFVITVGKPIGGVGESVAVSRRVETHGGSVAAVL